MRTYELVLVVKPSLTEPQRKKLLETVKSWLKDLSIKEESWGSKALAYRIKNELTGYYYDLQLETKTSIPVDLEKKLVENENILRHLVIRKK